ncbi:MAG: DUF5343 domain-containing protein [Acidimicrobiales bacterium]
MALPYVLNTGNLLKFLEKIQTVKVPDPLDNAYLKQTGFSGANDQMLTGLMKHLGFTDKQGKPEQRWHDYRHTARAPKVLALGIQEAWSGFFDLYPDGHVQSDTTFGDWARGAEPKASEKTVARSLKTFRTLITLADFSNSRLSEAPAPDPQQQNNGSGLQHQTQETPTPKVNLSSVGGITINIELQIPATADAKFFEQFFSSMRKHLLDENA